MNTKEKLLLTEVIKYGAKTVSDCIVALEGGEYYSQNEFSQENVERLHAELTEFLANGGRDGMGDWYVSDRAEHDLQLDNYNLIVYLADFAGELISWVGNAGVDIDDVDFNMKESYVVL